MEEEYHNGEGLTMADLGLSLEELAGQPLELFAREGARMILTVALEEEVTAFLSRRCYFRFENRLTAFHLLMQATIRWLARASYGLTNQKML